MKKLCIPIILGILSSPFAQGEDLLQIYQMALKNDPVTLKSKSDRDAAFVDVDINRAPLLPQLSLQLSASLLKETSDDAYGQSSQIDPTTGLRLPGGGMDQTGNRATLSLQQSIFNMSNWNSLDRAELVATQADASYALTKQNLLLRTVSAYLGVLQARDDLTFARAEKRAISRQLEQTKSRFSVGLTAITDVHEAQALFDNAVASEISAQNNVEISLEVLREITGQYHSDINALDMQRFHAHKPNPELVENWLTMATQGNYELLAAKLGVDISQQNIDIAKAGHYPTIDLSASFNSQADDGPSQRIAFDRYDNYNIGVQLSLPLYQGNRVTASSKAARLRYVSSAEELERIRRSVVRNVRSNYYNVVASISRIKALDQAVISAESAVKATEAGFEVGTRNIVEVLNSTRGLFDAKRNQSAARYQYINNILQLKQSAGSLTEEDLVSINTGLYSN